MKKLIVLLGAATAICGCKSIKLEKVERKPMADGTVVENLVRGEYYAYGLQNNLEGLDIVYSPTTGVRVAINKVSYDMSEKHAEIVDKSLSGAADLAAKVGAAIATAGGSVGADAIAGAVKRFVSNGGDASKAKVSVTDGKLTCTDGACYEVIDCATGACAD